MKMIPSIQLFCTFVIPFCHASQKTLELYQQGKIFYRKAVSEDAPYITKLINEKAHRDKTKIVILPRKFREQSVMSAVEKQKLYVAESFKDDIIAFKKLFVITDPAEYHAITHDEIRCEGPTSNPLYYNILFTSSKSVDLTQKVSSFFSLKDSIVIYLGDNYTHPDYRNRGIDSELTRVAFNLIKKDVYSQFDRKVDPARLVLLYHLTQENAGQAGNTSIDRTPSISLAFMKFIEEITTQFCYKNNHVLHHICYYSSMPTFYPESEECIPEYAVPGYGNVLIFPLEKNYR